MSCVRPIEPEEEDISYTLPVFLAHAIKMEEEATERYLELADMMEGHNNLDVSKLSRDMNRFSILHGASIRERAAEVELPELRHADLKWLALWKSPTRTYSATCSKTSSRGRREAIDGVVIPSWASGRTPYGVSDREVLLRRNG